MAQKLKDDSVEVRVLKEMAGAVCHEVNQPLQAVSGNAQLLMLGISEDHPMYDKLKKIKESAERAGDILNRIHSDIKRYVTMDYIEGANVIIDIEASTMSEQAYQAFLESQKSTSSE